MQTLIKQMGKNKLYILALILLVSPFYLNDFSNMYVKNWRWWLFIDYVGVKLFPFLIVLWLIHRKKMWSSEFGLTTQTIPSFLTICLAMTLVGTAIDQNAYTLIEKLPGYPPLGRMPAITNPIWNWIDLTFGLLMVGIFEELVFRGYMYTFLRRYTQSMFAIVIISSVAFGLIHWSAGLHAVLITSTIGAVWMIAYLKTRFLPAIMLAHFLLNFIAFANVIPQSIFKFF